MQTLWFEKKGSTLFICI